MRIKSHHISFVLAIGLFYVFYSIINLEIPKEVQEHMDEKPRLLTEVEKNVKKFDHESVLCLAKNAYFEARNQSILSQIAVSQVDRYSFMASATLNQGDVIRVIINDIIFSSVVTSDTATRTILEGLEDRVNFGPNASLVDVNADVFESSGEFFLQLTSDIAGRSFTTTGTMVTTVTNTINIVTSTPNQLVNYGYEWTNESGAIVGTSLNL